MDYRILLSLAVILIGTKLLGLLAKRIHLPEVAGMLLAGVILGPMVLNFAQPSDFLSSLSQIGVIVLMFTAGVEADFEEIKKNFRASFVIALTGVLFPLGIGYLVAHCHGVGAGESNAILRKVFVGIILTATSVSITVETLREMGKLTGKTGNTILAAAIIDDVLGMIGLAAVSSLTSGGRMLPAVGKMLLFFLLAAAVGLVLRKLLAEWFDSFRENHQRFTTVALAAAFIFAYLAEHYFGVADITGAFVAGIIFSGSKRSGYITSRIGVISKTLLSPAFFAGIGLQMVLPHITLSLVGFSGSLLIAAIVSKIAGCGLGARFMGYSQQESLQIGIGMFSRGEVALIMASRGVSMGLLSSEVLTPIIIVVLISTILTPVFLKLVFGPGVL